jgi:hypothetical protein
MEESMSKASLQQAAIGDLAQTPKSQGRQQEGQGRPVEKLSVELQNHESQGLP